MDRRRAVARVLVALTAAAAASGCGASQSAPTPTMRDAECYSAVGFVNGSWTLLAAAPAPTSQPWVNSPTDCHYRVATDTAGNKSAVLDPKGCYGLDAAGSAIVRRADFCPARPTGRELRRGTQSAG